MPPRRRRDEEERFNFDIPPFLSRNKKWFQWSERLEISPWKMWLKYVGDFDSLTSNFHFFWDDEIPTTRTNGKTGKNNDSRTKSNQEAIPNPPTNMRNNSFRRRRPQIPPMLLKLKNHPFESEGYFFLQSFLFSQPKQVDGFFQLGSRKTFMFGDLFWNSEPRITWKFDEICVDGKNLQWSANKISEIFLFAYIITGSTIFPNCLKHPQYKADGLSFVGLNKIHFFGERNPGSKKSRT